MTGPTTPSHCARCQHPLEDGSRFCSNCGTPVEHVRRSESYRPPAPGFVECSSCHHENDPDSSYCERCGTQLASPWSRPAAPGHGSYRPRAAPASEDPWETGPGYERPPRRKGALCPRCRSETDPVDTACVNCGLPLAEVLNRHGIPAAVAMRGEPAGFWIRLVALIVDGVIVNIALAIITGIIGVNIFGAESEQATTVADVLFQILAILGPMSYSVLFLSATGTTPGKRLFRIYIMDRRGNRKPSFGRALARELSKYISYLTLLIGFLIAAFRGDKRSLHDLIAGTYPTVR